MNQEMHAVAIILEAATVRKVIVHIDSGVMPLRGDTLYFTDDGRYPRFLVHASGRGRLILKEIQEDTSYEEVMRLVESDTDPRIKEFA